MANPTKVWVETIQSHLDLLNRVVVKLPAEEKLEVDDLNKILVEVETFKTVFLLQMGFQGFKIAPRENNPHS